MTGPRRMRPESAEADSELAVSYVIEPERRMAVLGFLKDLSGIAQQYNCSLSQLSIAYLLCRGDFINVICGMRKTKHVEENAHAADIIVSQDDLQRIRSLSEKLQHSINS